MIIDCDTHISPIAEEGIGVTAEELIERMDKAGIDKALTWPFFPYQRERLPEYCEYIYKSVKAYPERLIGFGWIDPLVGDKAVELTKICMEQYGLRGIKLHGSRNPHRYDDLELLCPIVDVVAKAGGVVSMHSSDDSPDRTHPYQSAKLVKRYPETTFLIIHMGGDLSACAVEMAKQLPNIYLVGSHIGMPAVLSGINELGADRVCFGSDTPFNLTHVEVAAYKAMLSEHPAQDVKNVLGGNIARIMNIN